MCVFLLWYKTNKPVGRHRQNNAHNIDGIYHNCIWHVQHPAGGGIYKQMVFLSRRHTGRQGSLPACRHHSFHTGSRLFFPCSKDSLLRQSNRSQGKGNSTTAISFYDYSLGHNRNFFYPVLSVPKYFPYI